MADGWSTGLLCKGCGEALASQAGGQNILESHTDSGGPFIRCLHCGGRHYYTLNENGEPVLRYFKPEQRLLYGLRRKLRLLGP